MPKTPPPPMDSELFGTPRRRDHRGRPTLVDIPRSVRIPASVVVEILAGIIVGPHVLDLVQPDVLIVFLSSVGLAFLFFLAGMEIDFLQIRGRPARLAVWGLVLLTSRSLSPSQASSRRPAWCSRPC